MPLPERLTLEGMVHPDKAGQPWAQTVFELVGFVTYNRTHDRPELTGPAWFNSYVNMQGSWWLVSDKDGQVRPVTWEHAQEQSSTKAVLAFFSQVAP